MTLSSNDFRAWISPIKSKKESDGKWDYRITVQRLTDGMIRQTKASGGWIIAEACANCLAHELGLPGVDTL